MSRITIEAVTAAGLYFGEAEEADKPRVVVVPPILWAALNNRLQQTGYGRLVALGDGGHKLELTDAGQAADDAEARELRLTILYLQGAGIRVREALPRSMQPLVPKPNFVAMRAKLLGKKGRW